MLKLQVNVLKMHLFRQRNKQCRLEAYNSLRREMDLRWDLISNQKPQISKYLTKKLQSQILKRKIKMINMHHMNHRIRFGYKSKNLLSYRMKSLILIKTKRVTMFLLLRRSKMMRR